MSYVDNDIFESTLDCFGVSPTATQKAQTIREADLWIVIIQEQKFRGTMNADSLTYYTTKKAIALLGANLLATRITDGQYPPGLKQAIAECDRLEKTTSKEIGGGWNVVPINRGVSGSDE